MKIEPKGHGLDLVTDVVTTESCVRVLVPLNTHPVEILMHVKSVENQSHSVGVVWSKSLKRGVLAHMPFQRQAVEFGRAASSSSFDLCSNSGDL
ncbi:hypothetical protein TNCV_3366041 [Trichonephila clavipes]|nr:hypothetical protein TNCV_3366041 [Trichonephila clavipes]